jgi:mono/diheme cytochrome c family protein
VFCNAQTFSPLIPRAWDARETNSFELPLAQPDRSPRYPSEKEYYSYEVRPIYRTYPIYAPDREPSGYWESLQQREPEIVFDAAALKTKQDWIRAGELVFESPILYVAPANRARYMEMFRAVPYPTTAEGIIPNFKYVIRKKGVVEIGVNACAECHTRTLADGSVVKGAQANEPSGPARAWRQEHPARVGGRLAENERAAYAAPWAPNQDDYDSLTNEAINLRYRMMPPGVLSRQGTSSKHPVRIPSIIGVADLKYLDSTGLSRLRSIADFMRYAIVNQGLDTIAHFGDFQPGTLGGQTPEQRKARYSDEQLFALALYVYSLKYPPNPNPMSDRARRGQQIFSSQGCAGCHPPPLYTNNALTPAAGFRVSNALRKTDYILDTCVGTDPSLALETRRGTGFYKVPSLRGVWLRSAFGHEGAAISLEEWLDPGRLNPDYVPKGFHLAPGPIKGHKFGLTLSQEDRTALIAFLNTL